MGKRKQKTGPEAPEGLAQEARARWQTVAPLLAARGPVDVDLLATYCQTWARWQEAERGIARAGALVRGARGGVVTSPLLAVSNQAAAQVRQLEKALRLDESSEKTNDDAPSGLLTRRELSHALGVHMMTVTKWEREGLPIASRGARGRATFYREADVREWRRQRDEAARQGNGGEGVNLVADRARKERAQAVEAEQRVAIKARDLLPRDQVERLWTAEVTAVRAKLLALPAAVADRVYRVARTEGANGVEAVLQDAIRDVLLELANPDREPTQVPA